MVNLSGLGGTCNALELIVRKVKKGKQEAFDEAMPQFQKFARTLPGVIAVNEYK